MAGAPPEYIAAQAVVFGLTQPARLRFDFEQFPPTEVKILSPNAVDLLRAMPTIAARR